MNKYLLSTLILGAVFAVCSCSNASGSRPVPGTSSESITAGGTSEQPSIPGTSSGEDSSQAESTTSEQPTTTSQPTTSEQPTTTSVSVPTTSEQPTTVVKEPYKVSIYVKDVYNDITQLRQEILIDPSKTSKDDAIASISKVMEDHKTELGNLSGYSFSWLDFDPETFVEETAIYNYQYTTTYKNLSLAIYVDKGVRIPAAIAKGLLSGAGDYIGGSTVTITAKESGSNVSFVGWYKNLGAANVKLGEFVSYSSSLDVSLDSATRLAAYYKLSGDVYIDATKVNLLAGEIEGIGDYHVGNMVTLTYTGSEDGIYTWVNVDTEFTYATGRNVKSVSFRATEDANVKLMFRKLTH